MNPVSPSIVATAHRRARLISSRACAVLISGGVPLTCDHIKYRVCARAREFARLHTIAHKRTKYTRYSRCARDAYASRYRGNTTSSAASLLLSSALVRLVVVVVVVDGVVVVGECSLPSSFDRLLDLECRRCSGVNA
jgi:hypothetical protein